MSVTCNTDINERYIITLADGTKVPGALKTGEAYLETCKPGAVITYKDWLDDKGQCASPRAIVTRTWLVTYGNNETVSCDQIITIEALDVDDIVWPSDYTEANALECSDVNQTPSLISAANTGYPILNGTPVNKTNLCMVSINVSDEQYDICPGSYEILRTWKVRNMCLPPLAGVNPVEYIQVIKVLDQEGPKVAYPDTVIVGTGPWTCDGTWEVPFPWITDNCSDSVSYTVRSWTGTPIQQADGSWIIINMKLGVHNVIITAQDACGNKTEKSICSISINPP